MPPSEAERQDTRKAMLYDLQKIIQKEDGLDEETVKRIFKIMDDYITVANQK